MYAHTYIYICTKYSPMRYSNCEKPMKPNIKTLKLYFDNKTQKQHLNNCKLFPRVGSNFSKVPVDVFWIPVVFDGSPKERVEKSSRGTDI